MIPISEYSSLVGQAREKRGDLWYAHSMISSRVIAAIVLFAATLSTLPTQAEEWNARFSMCGRDRVTCVVDGDTIWLQGVNLRLESYDTPEPYNDICGGQAEIALAKRASARLLQLLNGNTFTVQTSGKDRYNRVLATIRIGGTDVGDILIAEGLARRWPNGDEFWC